MRLIDAGIGHLTPCIHRNTYNRRNDRLKTAPRTVAGAAGAEVAVRYLWFVAESDENAPASWTLKRLVREHHRGPHLPDSPKMKGGNR